MRFTAAIILLTALLMAGCDQNPPDKRVMQQVTCVNNLKQIGLDFKIWAGDHNDQLPFNVGTNAGGTLELCDRDKDGFDRNSFLHFQIVSNELYVPRLLICPKDRAKTAAADWNSLRAANVTYLLRTRAGSTNANSREIIAVCPIDGNILYCDGTVLDKNGKTPVGQQYEMHVH